MPRREDILLSELMYDAFTAPARGSTHDNGNGGGPVANPPVITSSASPSVPENTVGTMFTVTATGGDGVLVYSIEGGADAAFFTIDSATGVVSSEEEFDFESPSDDDADNVYELTVGVSDGVNPAVTQDVMLTVTDLESPSFTSDDAFDFAEGATGVVFTAIATGGGGGYTFSLEGANGDYAFFSIDSETGEVSLDDPLDFEDPLDQDSDNVYEMRVVVTSANGEDASQEVTVTVTDVAEVYRYWRLTITQWSVAGTPGTTGDTRVSEWKLMVGATSHPATMTNTDTPSPLVATASDSHASFTAIWRVFDNQQSDGSRWISSTVGTSHWVQIDLGAGNEIMIDAHKIAPDAAVTAGYYPTAFNVKASNTGAFAGEEVTVDTRSGLTTGWVDITLRTFTL